MRIDDLFIGEYNYIEGATSYNEDFESDDGGYSASLAGFEYGIPITEPSTANSGSYVWATDLDGDYGDNANYKLDSSSIDLTTATNPYLAFYAWYDTEYSYDGWNVKVSDDDFATYTIVHPTVGYDDDSAYSGNAGIPLEPCFSGHTQMVWTEYFFDISAFAGSNIKVRWHLGSDSSVGYYSGVAIDDVRIVEIVDNSVIHLDEGFDPQPFPPAGWTVISSDIETWVRGTYQSTDGAASAEQWWSNSEQDEYLISPVFDLSGGSVAEVTCDFWWHGSDYVNGPMTEHKDILVTGDGEHGI
jgi:hypothetical protein